MTSHPDTEFNLSTSCGIHGWVQQQSRLTLSWQANDWKPLPTAVASLYRFSPVVAPPVTAMVSKLLVSSLQRRKLNLKAKLESGSSIVSFRRLIPGAFNTGMTGSTCTASPRHKFPRLSQ